MFVHLITNFQSTQSKMSRCVEEMDIYISIFGDFNSSLSKNGSQEYRKLLKIKLWGTIIEYCIQAHCKILHPYY